MADQFSNPEQARDVLYAAMEWLADVDGYTRGDLEDLIDTNLETIYPEED
jgi:hypothetical protein